MKSVIKVCNLNTIEDVNKVRSAISSNQGVIACQINKEKGEINVVYDNYFLTLDKIIESVEDKGYTVI
jgi:copper chaperone